MKRADADAAPWGRAPSRSRMLTWAATLHGQSRARVLLVSLLWLVAVATADALSPAAYSFSIFYLLVVVRVSAGGARSHLVVTAAVTALTWSVIESVSLDLDSPWLPLVWNVAARFAVLCLSGLLVAAVIAGARVDRDLSHQDSLTGLYNRRGFDERAAVELDRAVRQQLTVSTLYLDVDRFKPVNDLHGHAAGDRLLIDVARAIRTGLRGYDIVARVGGDEFVALLPDADAETALAVAQRAADDLDDMCRREGWPVTLSVGAVTFEQVVTRPEELIAAADRLMYEAKSTGRTTGRSTVLAETSHRLPSPD